jgi:ribosomal protein S18 acetylase RimI-like enzyme
MVSLTTTTVADLDAPALAELRRTAFADHAPSDLLSRVLAEEAFARALHTAAPNPDALRLVTYSGETPVGWTYCVCRGPTQLEMVNSGVAAGFRRRGIYTRLVGLVLEHAKAQGLSTVTSRHTPENLAVLVAKLKLGFLVSGYEYSEVYGPLVRLTYRMHPLRLELYRSRAMPLRPADDAT